MQYFASSHYCIGSGIFLDGILAMVNAANIFAAKQNNSTPANWLNDPAQGFTGVQNTYYWSATAYDNSQAWVYYLVMGSAILQYRHQ